MSLQSRSERAKASAAFTLLELVLALALLLLLAGAVILSFGSLDRQSRLEEGASQVETLFRYARAQAADTGRQVRIVFSSERPDATGTASPTNSAPSSGSTNEFVEVLWEPDPVGAPGRFETLPGAQMLVEQVNDLVRVQSVGQAGMVARQVGDSGPAPDLDLFFVTGDTNGLASTPAAADATTNGLPPLTCYPDGSSDSFELVLAPADGDDPRLARVTLSGLTGRARHRIFTPHPDGSPSSADETEWDR